MKAKITWEWGDHNDEIIIRKAKGKLTLDDVWKFLHQPDQLNVFDGDLALIMFRVRRDRFDGGWYGEIDTNEGDSQVLFMIQDDTACPICGKHQLFPQYCPACGEKVKIPKLPGDRA